MEKGKKILKPRRGSIYNSLVMRNYFSKKEEAKKDASQSSKNKTSSPRRKTETSYKNDDKKPFSSEKKDQIKEKSDSSKSDKIKEKEVPPLITEAYFCKMCGVQAQSKVVWESHIKGKKHNKRLFQIQLEEGIIDPEETDIKVCEEIVLSPEEIQKSFLQEILEGSESPAIGLNYIIEVQNPNPDDREAYYSCLLCDSTSENNEILDHVVSTPHRLAYIKRKDPFGDKMISELKNKSDLDNIVQKRVVLLLKKYGTGVMEVQIGKKEEFIKFNKKKEKTSQNKYSDRSKKDSSFQSKEKNTSKSVSHRNSSPHAQVDERNRSHQPKSKDAVVRDEKDDYSSEKRKKVYEKLISRWIDPKNPSHNKAEKSQHSLHKDEVRDVHYKDSKQLLNKNKDIHDDNKSRYVEKEDKYSKNREIKEKKTSHYSEKNDAYHKVDSLSGKNRETKEKRSYDWDEINDEHYSGKTKHVHEKMASFSENANAYHKDKRVKYVDSETDENYYRRESKSDTLTSSFVGSNLMRQDTGEAYYRDLKKSEIDASYQDFDRMKELPTTVSSGTAQNSAGQFRVPLNMSHFPNSHQMPLNISSLPSATVPVSKFPGFVEVNINSSSTLPVKLRKIDQLDKISNSSKVLALSIMSKKLNTNTDQLGNMMSLMSRLNGALLLYEISCYRPDEQMRLSLKLMTGKAGIGLVSEDEAQKMLAAVQGETSNKNISNEEPKLVPPKAVKNVPQTQTIVPVDDSAEPEEDICVTQPVFSSELFTDNNSKGFWAQTATPDAQLLNSLASSTKHQTNDCISREQSSSIFDQVRKTIKSLNLPSNYDNRNNSNVDVDSWLYN